MVSQVVYLQNNVRPARNKTIYEDLSLKTKGESTRNLLIKVGCHCCQPLKKVR
jgi:hypothetical protein